jgi:hypothetical protein
MEKFWMWDVAREAMVLLFTKRRNLDVYSMVFIKYNWKLSPTGVKV